MASVTVTDTMLPACPLLTGNGMVSVNWLPYAFEAALEYQVVNADERDTVSVGLEIVLPVAGAN